MSGSVRAELINGYQGYNSNLRVIAALDNAYLVSSTGLRIDVYKYDPSQSANYQTTLLGSCYDTSTCTVTTYGYNSTSAAFYATFRDAVGHTFTSSNVPAPYYY